MFSVRGETESVFSVREKKCLWMKHKLTKSHQQILFQEPEVEYVEDYEGEDEDDLEDFDQLAEEEYEDEGENTVDVISAWRVYIATSRASEVFRWAAFQKYVYPRGSAAASSQQSCPSLCRREIEHVVPKEGSLWNSTHTRSVFKHRDSKLGLERPTAPATLLLSSQVCFHASRTQGSPLLWAPPARFCGELYAVLHSTKILVSGHPCSLSAI